jgi:hypothetical protein
MLSSSGNKILQRTNRFNLPTTLVRSFYVGCARKENKPPADVDVVFLDFDALWTCR